MHIVWRRRKHDGGWYASIEYEYAAPDNAAAKERARLTSETAELVRPEDRGLTLAQIARLYPVGKP